MADMGRRGLSLVTAALLLSACAARSAPAPPATSAAAALVVTSTAFTEGGTIPADFTCTGAGRRPPLAWSGEGHGAHAMAVGADDPDAPGREVYPSIVVDLPAETTGVTGGLPAGARQVENSAGDKGWTPPCPPSGTHHYRFTVYGLSAPTGLPPDASASDALAAIQKTAVVQGRLTGLVTHEG